jgi:hypothetical protein
MSYLSSNSLGISAVLSVTILIIFPSSDMN